MKQDENAQTISSKMKTIKQKLMNISSIFIYDTTFNTNLYYFPIGNFPAAQELYLESIPPSSITDLYSLKVQLKVLEIVNGGIPSLQKLLIPIDE